MIGEVVLGCTKTQSDFRLFVDGNYPKGSNTITEFLRVKNGLVKSFFEYLNTPVRLGTHPLWQITDVESFIAEVEKSLPVLSRDMDDLDYHCADQILIHVPQAIDKLKRFARAGNEDMNYYICIEA